MAKINVRRLLGRSYFVATLEELQRLFDAYETANPGGGGGASAIGDLTDVNVTGASNGDVLQFNGTSWVDAALSVPDSLSDLSDVDTSGASNGEVLGFDGTSWGPVAGGGGGSDYAHDSLSLGGVTAEVDRFGGSATVLTTPSAGVHNLEAQSGAHVDAISMFGNNTDLNASQEFVVEFDNSANSRDRRFSVQVYDANNGALIDQQATSTNHTQEVSGNITTLTFPGMNGFGATGFFIELR